ncbi:MAG TPA: diversity-generating retroelement protein bAvd family protein [Maribacter sp.]|uniref:four helix bundle protein n=1 Tax=Maribacter TaxID=252356 RepID=UPI000EE357B8|nr:MULTISPECIES: four helix bundle protein [Maribacter]HAF76907.1 diversity-generating retroelement protein bAvd family protein [Maribacter sp.]|tara:strand:+ start:136 stop:492 length:357 start_codon:yes stop_codon:yes gene_type:complete
MRDFKKLEIWKNGITIVKHVYSLVQKLPSEEKFGLKSQLSRAAVSVPSNIAEGCSRNSEVEFKRFLEIAQGSLFEVETQLIISEELKFLDSDELKSIFELISIESKMINSLISKIKNS